MLMPQGSQIDPKMTSESGWGNVTVHDFWASWCHCPLSWVTGGQRAFKMTKTRSPKQEKYNDKGQTQVGIV